MNKTTAHFTALQSSLQGIREQIQAQHRVYLTQMAKMNEMPGKIAVLPDHELKSLQDDLILPSADQSKSSYLWIGVPLALIFIAARQYF